MANNNYPQITSVTSEALQAQIRNLLPSQEGFGTDLMAQNVIVPIIDLTSAAEGSSVPQNLQTAYAFGDTTAFQRINTSGSIITNTGFWQIYGTVSIFSGNGVNNIAKLEISNGLSTKTLWQNEVLATTGVASYSYVFDITVFLSSGDSVSASSNSTNARMNGIYRQIADVNGTLVNPSGFNPQ